MQRCGISVCVIPHADMHQNEYISKSDAYLEFYSGFTGSAGTLVVTLDFIGLWTDGRYAIQAKQEIKNTPIHLFVEGVDGVVDFFTWIEQCIIEGNILGIDASLFSYNHYTKICKLCKKRNVELNLSFQPIDELWINRPKAAFQLPFILDQHFVGEYVESKLKRVRDKMSLLGATSYLLSALDEIAWLLNCRGSDIAYNPVFKAYMLITHDQCVVFLNRKVCNALLFSYFSSCGVMVYDYEFILSYLQSIRNANVLFDGAMVNAAMIEALDASNKKINVSSPIAQLKSTLDLVNRDYISKEEFHDLSHHFTKQIDQLQDNMNNLLTWSQSQLNGIITKPQAVSASIIIQEVIDLLKQQWQGKELQIQFQPFEEFVWMDPDHLKLVVRNLLSNAIKFSNKKHTIVFNHSRNNKELTISIRDTGMGMPQEQLDMLFTSDAIKSTHGTDKERGTGLGLKLCKEFLDKNNGEIWAISELGIGSTFFFTVPLKN